MSTRCPFCSHAVITDKDFAIKNKRIFCGTCCKSFDVQIENNQKDEEWYKKYIMGISDMDNKVDQEDDEDEYVDIDIPF